MRKEALPKKVRLTSNAARDILFWEQSGNQRILKKIHSLIADCLKSPYAGIGSPEQLRYQAQDTYSRRIDRVNRLVYRVEGDYLVILSARYHYER